MPFAITASKATLMHACLAHLSPEVDTLDEIIHNAPTKSTPSQVILPTEILLLIRELLFPMITAHLIQQSTDALNAYEDSLCSLLCQDCIAYNLDIYGPNIWQWEQFTGPCACVEIESPPGHRQSTTIGLTLRQGQRHTKTTSHDTASPSPKQFTNAQHWLEAHLSRQAVLRVERRGRAFPSESDSQTAPSAADAIWVAVALVLREYNCEAVREPDEKQSILTNSARGTSQYKTDVVQVIPVTSSNSDHTSLPLDLADSDWRARAILRRATRDLCLESKDPFGAHLRDASSFDARQCQLHPITSKAPTNHHQHLFQALLGIIGSLAAACLSLPITFATLALTIVCFYSRPRSFRII